MYSSELMFWPRGRVSTKIIPCAPPPKMAMIFPAEGLTLNPFFLGESGWCHYNFSAVQSDGSIFLLQWRTVTKSLQHQPRNGTANLNTSLCAQFYGSRLGFVEPNGHTDLNILRHQ
jgi:hypothetical protein